MSEHETDIPSDELVEANYVWWQSRVNGQTFKEAETAYRAWLARTIRRAKAEAWDEGCSEGDASAYNGLPSRPNPYRDPPS